MASTGIDAGGLHPDMEKRPSHSNAVPDELLASDADAELLGMFYASCEKINH